jgi:ABC-type dipeptide/oligopeptide/nickel transport system ATPase component
MKFDVNTRAGMRQDKKEKISRKALKMPASVTLDEAVYKKYPRHLSSGVAMRGVKNSSWC